MKYNKYLSKFFKFGCSLRFAVINLIGLGLVSAVGTFYESYYDLNTAHILVYRSIWMKLVLISLSTNLIGVLVDRWPWKKRHISFIMAHFGILTLIVGSLVTQYKGIDGSLRLGVGEKAKSLSLQEEVFIVYSSLDGNQWSELFKFSPEFIKQAPSSKKPYKFIIDAKQSLQIDDHYPYSKERVQIQPDPKGGHYLQFQLEGARANAIDSIYKSRLQASISKQIGLAHITFTTKKYKPKYGNELILRPVNKNTLRYTLVSNKKIRRRGRVKVGDRLETGWMDLNFKILQYYRARKEYHFTKLKRPLEKSVSALRVQFMDQIKWMRLNSFLSFYSEDRAYILGYMNKKQSLGVDIKLKHFKVTLYPNSSKAKEYESFVEVDGTKEFLISMNSPLTYGGWTFYQSGFEKDESSQIVASIFAVNKDPGRWIKYLGSFWIICGVFALFYIKRR